MPNLFALQRFSVKPPPVLSIIHILRLQLRLRVRGVQQPLES